MSGYSEEVITHHGVLEEGIDFVQKPFSIRYLTQRVREAVQGER
jgi:DNA-binding response OmpR family regulator